MKRSATRLVAKSPRNALAYAALSPRQVSAMVEKLVVHMPLE